MVVRYYIYNVKRYLWLKTETVLRCHNRFWKAVRELDFCPQNWFGHFRGSQRWQNDTHKASQRVGTTDILRDKGRWLGIDPSSFYCEQRPSSVSQWNSFPPINSVAPQPWEQWNHESKGSKMNTDHYRRHQGNSYPWQVWDEAIRQITHTSKGLWSQKHIPSQVRPGRPEEIILGLCQATQEGVVGVLWPDMWEEPVSLM